MTEPTGARAQRADVEVDIVVDATPDAVYALVADLNSLVDLAEETTEMSWRKGSTAKPGAVFTGHNRNGKHTWSTTCTITDADPGKRFAFDVKYTLLPIARWQYDFEAADGGCRVTERTWDRRPGWFKKLAVHATGVADRDSANSEHMTITLQRLKEAAEQQLS